MRVPLGGGSYKARSIISSAQRCVNLYAEQGHAGSILDVQGNPTGEALAGGIRGGQSILYPTPGLRQLSTPPTPGPARGLYWSTTDTLFYVCNDTLYRVAADFSMTAVGTIAAGSTPVSMADNGLHLVLVDGTTNGWQIDLTTFAMQPISAANNSPPAAIGVYGFYGADRVSVMDGYFILNKPGTGTYYASYNGEPSGQIQFDSLWFAQKNGYPDRLVAAVVNQRSIWLIGERTTEIHYNAGAAQFPFAVIDGPYVEHGCVAKYSIARLNESILWLSQDQTGQNILVITAGYQVTRVSTHPIETEWSTYPTVADATAHTWQQNGHVFYQIDFPSADKSWRYDATTKEWHEAVWTDADGAEHRHRAGRTAFAYGINVAADWSNGSLYALDSAVYTDVGSPILRRRDFPHIVNDGNRVFYDALILDMDVGKSVGTSIGPPDTSPQVLLRWSNDRGRTFGNPVSGSLGATGQYLTSVQFTRLGLARDRVFSVEWDAPVDTALQGAWINLRPVAS